MQVVDDAVLTEEGGAGPGAPRRRTVMIAGAVVAVVAIVLGVTVLTRSSGPPYLSTHGETETLSLWKPGTKPTAAQAAAQDRLIHATRRAMAPIVDAAAATKAGYTIAPHPENQPADGLEHWGNPAYFDDGRVLDPSRPESLVIRSSTGEVVGAMFVSYGATPEPGPDATWHRHPIGQEVCYPVTGAALLEAAQQETAGTTKVYRKDCPAGYELLANTAYMMHVWLIRTRGGPFDESMSLPGVDTSTRIP